MRVRYFPRHTERKSRMTAFKRRVRDGERATEKEARPTGRGRLSKPNETRKNMGISTIHMSAFVLSLRDNKTKGQPSLYLGLGLASYIALESIFFGCSADVGAAPLCCGCGGGGLSPPDRGRSGGHRSYLRRVFRLKEEGRQLKCQHRNRKSRASKWNSSKIHCSILLHALLPKCRETCEGRSGLVGPESHGRGRLSKIIYWCY